MGNHTSRLKKHKTMPASCDAGFHHKESGDFASQALQRHNYLRNLHRCPPLKLSKELCVSAQKYAELLLLRRKLEHGNCNDFGENIGYKMHSTKVELSGKEATDIWYSEIENMNFHKGTQFQSGHFSQVIWKSTNEAGFGLAISTDGREAYFVGQYRPPGNFEGQWNENVPPPKNGKAVVPK